MRLIFRLLWLILSRVRGERVDFMDSVDTRMRVYPNDLDIFLHVNNGVYLSYADLGRMDLMLRSGTFNRIRKRGWYPVVAEETIQFRKSLTLGQVFNINTRIVGWDERAIFMEQVFTRGDELIARAIIHARFLSRSGGKVSTRDLMDLLKIDRQSPRLPDYVRAWVESTRLQARLHSNLQSQAPT